MYTTNYAPIHEWVFTRAETNSTILEYKFKRMVLSKQDTTTIVLLDSG